MVVAVVAHVLLLQRQCKASEIELAMISEPPPVLCAKVVQGKLKYKTLPQIFIPGLQRVLYKGGNFLCFQK